MWAELAAAAAGTSGVMYYAAGVPSSQLFGPALVSGGRQERDARVALTFDDGPSESTPEILEILREHGAKATFFQVGRNAERLPELARQVAREGHEIGSHTHSHPRFYLCTPWQVSTEIGRGQQALSEVHGLSPRLFRPPYGVRWFGMFPALERLGLRAVMWSVSSGDWKQPAEWVAGRVLSYVSDGDVVLMHDGDTTVPGDRRRETARALRSILATFAARKIRAVTVSELFCGGQAYA